ncbi:MAG: potassium transporter Kup [Polyangiales bacterium]
MPNKSSDSASDRQARRRFAILSFAAFGVVYGDIGTSPLYAIRECFHGDYGIEVTPENILGVLSLVFWSLMIIVTIKYLFVVLHADNNGEGGVMALTALAGMCLPIGSNRRRIALVVGLFAAALLYGDSMITPSISVLSAVEGIQIITPRFGPYVIPVTVAVLVGLFALQRHGTTRIGTLFGPIMLVWFAVLMVLGIRSVVTSPAVLKAASPWYGAQFLLHNGSHGFLVLGAVFLVVTGAEAMYADLGHFGRRPIRLAWLAGALPALLCNYFGQGALLLRDPSAAFHPFYGLVPSWAHVPVVVLATFATVIASQAVISGAFSLTKQAIQMGYLPRLRVIHTSDSEPGQIYIPQVNFILMVATVALVFGFRSSSRLAAAYGVAVTTTMLITTMLLYVVARNRWGWSVWKASIPLTLFLFVDLSFFAANISKIAHGAWFPLAIGAAVFVMMTTWRKGRAILSQRVYDQGQPLEQFAREISADTLRVPGKAVFLAGRPQITPPALIHNLKHNHAIHENVAVVTVLTEETPRVPRDEKVSVEGLENGFFRVVARYGFMEDPNVPYVLALAREKGLDFEIAEVSFFLGRETLLPDRHPLMPIWRERIFAFMSRNAQSPTAFFGIPPDQVVELGTQVKI